MRNTVLAQLGDRLQIVSHTNGDNDRTHNLLLKQPHANTWDLLTRLDFTDPTELREFASTLLAIADHNTNPHHDED